MQRLGSAKCGFPYHLRRESSSDSEIGSREWGVGSRKRNFFPSFGQYHRKIMLALFRERASARGNRKYVEQA